MSSQVLFICTGNFYRSRFAEIFFNHQAAAQSVGWNAISRGLATHLTDDLGPISPYAVKALKRLKIKRTDKPRRPVQLTLEDLENSRRIIAIKEEEHRPMLQDQFPEWVDRVEYWRVHDIDVVKPKHALPELQKLIKVLMEEIRQSEFSASGG